MLKNLIWKLLSHIREQADWRNIINTRYFGDPNQSIQKELDCKEIQLVNPKGNQPWIFIGRIDAEAETPMLWLPDVKNWLRIRKRPWSWERLKAGGDGDDRGQDGWMASPTRWTWVWASSESWWYIGKHGVFQSTGSQQIGHNWAAELIQFNVCLKLHRCSFPHY